MSSLKGKKLLILAGAAVHTKVVEAAREMGVYTIVTDYLPDSPAKALADESWMLSVTDVDAIVEQCREAHVDGVLNFCIDPAQLPYQQICERLQVPCYGTREQFHQMTTKTLFKELCQRCGLDVIPSYSLEELKAGKIPYPVYVKPAYSRGSRGQFLCRDLNETMEAIEKAKKESFDGMAVIEKYMQGKPDFSMTYFVCDGVPYLERLCDRFLGDEKDGLNKQCIAAISPSRFSDLYLREIDRKARKFISALGVQNGPVFMQGFVDGDTIRFYDPGLRFPGGEYERFVKQATGVDMMRLLIEFALSGKITCGGLDPNLYQLNGMHSVQLNFDCRGGTIGKLIGLDTVAANPMVQSIFTRYQEGETVRGSGDVGQRVCEVGILVDQNHSVRETILWIQSQIEILDEAGESMLVSLFDPTVLDF